MKTKINWDSWQVSIGMALAWLVTSVGAVVSGLCIREVIIRIASLFQDVSQQAYKQKGGIGFDFTPGRVVFLLDNIILIVLGVGLVTSVVWIEYYFRKGRPEGLLLKRIGIVVGVEAAIILVSILFMLVV